MIKIKHTVIMEKDLKKLMKIKGIKSVRQLAIISGVEYTYLTKVFKGRYFLSEKSWDKIKVCL